MYTFLYVVSVIFGDKVLIVIVEVTAGRVTEIYAMRFYSAVFAIDSVMLVLAIKFVRILRIGIPIRDYGP